MKLPNRGERKRHTGGPLRTPGKAALIQGCELRVCNECGTRVFVPAYSDWNTCAPCKKGWR